MASLRSNQSRKRSPEKSVNGRPLLCTFIPGACPAINNRAVRSNQTIGRGACEVCVEAKRSAHRVQSEIWEANVMEYTYTNFTAKPAKPKVNQSIQINF